MCRNSFVRTGWCRLAYVATLVLSGCTPEASVIRVERSAVVLSTDGTSGSLYFTVSSVGQRADSIVGIAVNEAGDAVMETAQPHRMPSIGAASSSTTMMMPVRAVRVPANGSVRFVPGGFTGWIPRFRLPVAIGDSVRFSIRLASGGRASSIARAMTFADLDTALTPPRSDAVAALTMAPSVAEGRSLYRANGCASCHGANGRGDGPVGLTLTPRPRDLRDTLAFTNGTSIPAIAQTIATGIPAGGAMPMFAHLTNAERESLALYILSLRTQPSTRIPAP